MVMTTFNAGHMVTEQSSIEAGPLAPNAFVRHDAKTNSNLSAHTSYPPHSSFHTMGGGHTERAAAGGS